MYRQTLIFTIFLFSISTINAQVLLDVGGDAKIHGNLELLKAAGDSSLFIGANAGINDDGSANRNTFVGANTGKANTTGSSNTFLGFSAGTSNLGGKENVFVGYKAGYTNISANNNVFIGYYSGYESISGYYNVFMGHGTGRYNVDGDDNVFIGYNSGRFNETGSQNVFFGRNSGYQNNSGSKNVFLGYQAGVNNIAGINNLFLGTTSGLLNPADSLDHAIAIGYGAKVACHNCAVIGGTGADSVKVGIGTATPEKILDVHGEMVIRENNKIATFESSNSNSFIRLETNGGAQGASVGYFNNGASKYYFVDLPGGVFGEFVIQNDGDVGIGLINPGCKLDVAGDVCSNGSMLTSDQRFKKNIKKIEKPLEKLARIEGVTYRMRTEKFEGRNFSKGKKIGLIAQNVEKTFPELVKTFKDGYKAVNYDGLIPVLVEGINQQQVLIQEQQVQIDELKLLVEQLVQNKSTAPKNPVYHLELSKQASLSQNLPNPFSDYTMVEYFIPEGVQQASLQITSRDGKILGKLQLKEKGKGSVQIKTTFFPAGTYFYSLILDGKVQETKKMVLSRK